MDLNTLPRAIAMQYDTGEIVFPTGGRPIAQPWSYNGSGLRTYGKNPDFLADERFRRAHACGWTRGGKKTVHIDDNRWILHVALWAANQASLLPGDFVECGVDTGMMSSAICEWVGFNRLDKDFWLFDTFNGIPEAQMSPAERAGIAAWHNQSAYQECFAEAQANFAPWPRCRLVRGEVPKSLAAFPSDRAVAYLSIDMNIVQPELAAIEFFWDRLVPGAVILLDDYGWATHAAQKAAFDEFAQRHGTMVLSIPTGQGLIIR